VTADFFENWPVTFEPPARRIVDPPMPVLVNVAMTIAGRNTLSRHP
jgi:hypothetical protein